MKEFSNKFIFIFSVIMVIVVAVLLSLAATLLQPMQQKNFEIEKKKSMLESIEVTATRENTEELYDRYVETGFVINQKGEIVDTVDAFTVELRVEQRKPLEEQYLPLFHAESDKGETLTIIPVEGKGLWGPIFGYVALREDMSTIFGVTFDHKGETPGLGAEINTPPFENMFKGKKFFEEDKFVSIGVIKGGARQGDPHSVDAVSGGTITSQGLEDMLYNGIGKYSEYLLKNKK
jgi:Na+-transporting NADH:ubiquinone oxidoreductase subunit C